MMTVQEATDLIRKKKKLFIAGDEALLASLPQGAWIGGTIPYFMTELGGMFTQELLQVMQLPDFVLAANVQFYDVDEMERIPADYQTNGFAYVVLPAFSEAHLRFAQECPNWPGVFDRPLVGWVAGIDLKDAGKVAPKVFNGQSGESSSTKVAVMHVNLPPELFAKASIVNIFHPGQGEIITFPTAGFEASECSINGKTLNLAEYLEAEKIDTHLPLVADYMGAMVNVSFQSVDARAGKVTFYAPVFPGVQYKIAEPVSDYAAEFDKKLSARNPRPVCTCNCILNYLYARLEGKKTGEIVGPITFGEIAYMLLNQTLVYLTFEQR